MKIVAITSWARRCCRPWRRGPRRRRLPGVKSFLDDLTDAQRTLLTRLPYRAGLYLSRADMTGGADADAAEMAALAGIVEAYATEVFGCETMQHTINATLAAKAHWPRWGDALARVPEECREAMAVLRPRVDVKEARGFAHHLLNIAEAVALAFREVAAAPPLGQKLALYWAYFRERAHRGRLASYDFDTFMHISADERRALAALTGALGPEGV